MTVQIGPTGQRMEARIAQGHERERLWAELVRRYPGYAKY